MTAKHNMESQCQNDAADIGVVREMERRMAKQEAAREWRPWIITLIVVLVLLGALVLASFLLPALLMRGFT